HRPVAGHLAVFNLRVRRGYLEAEAARHLDVADRDLASRPTHVVLRLATRAALDRSRHELAENQSLSYGRGGRRDGRRCFQITRLESTSAKLWRGLYDRSVAP